MKISVTQEHIDKGRKGKCHSCPIALAIIEALPNINVGVTGHYVYLRKLDEHLSEQSEISLPSEARRFIWYFDFDRSVEPFEFELEIPARLLP